jgi:hypothetical protein
LPRSDESELAMTDNLVVSRISHQVSHFSGYVSRNVCSVVFSLVLVESYSGYNGYYPAAALFIAKLYLARTKGE